MIGFGSPIQIQIISSIDTKRSDLKYKREKAKKSAIHSRIGAETKVKIKDHGQEIWVKTNHIDKEYRFCYRLHSKADRFEFGLRSIQMHITIIVVR